MQLTFDKIDGGETTVPCCCDGCAMVGFDVNGAAYDGAVCYHVHTHKCARAKHTTSECVQKSIEDAHIFTCVHGCVCACVFIVVGGVMAAMAMIVMVMVMVFVTDKNQCN